MGLGTYQRPGLSHRGFLGQRGGTVAAACSWAALLAFIPSAHSLLAFQLYLEFFPPFFLLPVPSVCPWVEHKASMYLSLLHGIQVLYHLHILSSVSPNPAKVSLCFQTQNPPASASHVLGLGECLNAWSRVVFLTVSPTWPE